MFYIALGALIGGVVVSFAYGNRRLPTVILLLGVALTVLMFAGIGGFLDVVGIAVLAVVIWIANKADMGMT